jgi:hypothetical protein
LFFLDRGYAQKMSTAALARRARAAQEKEHQRYQNGHEWLVLFVGENQINGNDLDSGAAAIET